MIYQLADLPFLREKGHVVSLVGGGGKTTILYAMARLCASRGHRVLVSTTTHILQPELCYAPSEAARDALWSAGRYAVAGVSSSGGKLTALPPAELARWMERADTVLLEADGAKHHPCKAPAAHEPVIPPASDVVLAVAGLSAVGRPLREVCFRLSEACALLGASPDAVLTPQMLAILLTSEAGGRKGVGTREFYVVLNQADDEERLRAGEETMRAIQFSGIQKGIITHFEKGERA